MSDPIREIICQAHNERWPGTDPAVAPAFANYLISFLHRHGYAIVHEDNVNQWPEE